MRKIIGLMIIIVLSFLLMGCPDEETVDMENFQIDFSIYTILPQQAFNQNNENHKTNAYKKLEDGYQYIEGLFTVYEQIIDNAIRNKKVEMNQNKWLEHYEVFTVYGSNEENLKIDDLFNNRKITLTKKTLENNDVLYTGAHIAAMGLFTFEYQENSHVNIHFERYDRFEKSYALITKDEETVNTKVYYRGGDEEYELYSVTNSDYTTIYYTLNDGTDIKSLQVFNNNGESIYQALDVDNGNYQYSGWIINDEVEKIASDQYLINKETFTNSPNQVNLYEVRNDYLDGDSQNVYLLGDSTFVSQFVPLIKAREPFIIKDSRVIEELVQGTYSFYQETKDVLK